MYETSSEGISSGEKHFMARYYALIDLHESLIHLG